IAGLADGGDATVPEADVGLHDAPVIDDERVGDDGVDGAVGAGTLALAHAVADDLAAAELHFFAVDRVVALDLDEEFGVGAADAGAHRGPEHGGIGAARELMRHGSASQRAADAALEALHDAGAGIGDEAHAAAPGPAPAPRAFRCDRLSGARRPPRLAPGSKRRPVPAGMSRRNPRACSRSNRRAGLVS